MAKYRFNKDLLSFVPIQKSIREKLMSFLLYSVGFIFAAVIANIVFSHFRETPKEKRLLREQSDLIVKYMMLNKQLDQISLVMSDIQQRDDLVYRPIFDAKAIPQSIREAGFGGVNRYASLENMKESELMVNTAKRVDKLLKQIYIQSKSYDEVIELARNKDKMIACVPAIQPVALNDFYRLTSYFGQRIDPFLSFGKWHQGMDFAASVGTKIYATGDGVVSIAGYSNGGYGNCIDICHGFGYLTRYAHLSKIIVKQGQRVKRGEVIGLMGSTGRSTGSHLHYEVQCNKVPMNPINFYFNDITPEQYDLMVRLSAEEGGKTMD